MRTNIFSIFAILMAVFFTSCEETSDYGTAAIPQCWEPASDFYEADGEIFVNANIIFDDKNVTKMVRHQVTLTTEERIQAVGEYPFFCEDNLSEGKYAISEENTAMMQYKYCYDKINTIKVNGLIMSYTHNSKTYSLPCASTIKVIGSMTEAVETETGLANSTVYTAVANGKKLAKGVQEFLAVKPDAPVVDPAEPIKWYPISNTKAVVVFDNDSTAEVAHNMGITAEELIKREGITALSYNSLSAKAASSINFNYNHNINNVVKVSGLDFIYNYNGKEYKNLPCAVEMTVKGNHSVTTNKKDGYEFYELSKTVYSLYAGETAIAEATQNFEISKAAAPIVEPAEPIKWYPISNTKAVVVFDNDSTAEVAHNMGITAEELIKREGTTALSYNSLSAKAASSINFNYNHNINNVVKVNGLNFVYKYNGKEYKNLPCAVEMTVKGSHSVVENSKNGYEFYELSKTVYSLFAGETAIAEATQNFEISKARTLVSEDITFEHGAYKTPSYSNGIITIICDNVMNVLQKYSDNTSNETEVDYTVSNLYNVAIPVFVLNSKDALVGVSANFANGVAKVLGKNITVSHRSNNVSDIIFNGKNYRDDSRRPNCKPMAQSIYFKSENKAEITFDNGQTVEVDYNVKVAINFDGVLVKGWATDSYVDGGSGVAAHEGTYFHFVVNKNGAYTMYSAKVKENISVADFTATSVSENFVNTLSNEKPAAFTGKSVSTYDLGYINKIVKYSEDTYIIQYYNGNDKLDRTVGQSGAAIGSNYRYPIRGTWSEDVISVEGTTYYITGSQN